jgi:anti-sigma factor RsiW
MSERQTYASDDERLTAFIDGALDDSERVALRARLDAEPDLRARLALLRQADLPYVGAFAPVLEKAPVDRLQAMLDGALRGAITPASRMRLFVRLAAAAIAALLFVGGYSLGRLTMHEGAPSSSASREEDWRQTVAEYMSLYTPDTFATVSADLSPRALKAFGQKLGLDLSADSIALPGASPHVAMMLQYDGAPLGEIAYLDGADPLAFCIRPVAEPDSAPKLETRDGFASASWAHRGRSYMLIGRAPQQRIAELAQALAARF